MGDMVGRGLFVDYVRWDRHLGPIGFPLFCRIEKMDLGLVW
jgi:hypothetical protein